MKLNPAKCSFGVSSGQFLGHVVNHRGIEVSPAQAEALISNAEPKTIKEVQALTGKIAALSRFISKLSNRYKPFFDTIRGHGRQTWGDEQRQALTSLKEYMCNPPVLSAPEPNEKLFLYLEVSSLATSAVLIRCKEGKQFLVFYVSKTMSEPERRYSRAERMILSLVNAKRKLRHYFESHPIVVLKTFPLRMILHKLDLSGRMTKWAIELSSFDIAYEPKLAIKGQAVADFLLDCDAEDTVEDCNCSWWKLFVDGSSNQMGAGIGIQLQTPEGTTLSQAIRLEFSATNNEAEYEALIAGLKLAKELKIKNLMAYRNSQLVIRQVNGDYGAKDKTMEAYRTTVLREAKAFDQIRFIQLPREYNEDADRLACSVSSFGDTLARVIPIDILIQPSIFEELPNPSTQHVNVIPYEPSWIDPIIAYIRSGTLPERKDEARRIRSSAAKYAIVHDQLYRRSFSGPYLKCATPTEARQIMRTIHEGVCGNHSGGRSLAHKAMTQGYFWPHMARDAEEFSRRCDKCQRFGSLIHQPPEDLHVMATPWPFAQWGMDVVGPLPTARSQNKYVLLATDYFTKWVEAEPYPSVTQTQVRHFIWNNIICRFGVPRSIVMDNGTNLNSKQVRELLEEYGINQKLAAVSHPQANGQAKITNRTIFACIKKKLENEKGKWLDELPNVLWAYRTTPRQPTGESPFAMAYGTEAVIPVEHLVPTVRSLAWDQEQNDRMLRFNLDLLEEKRDVAAVRLGSYQQTLVNSHNKKVRHKGFALGDLVLKRKVGIVKKMFSLWEGPYRIAEVIGKGAYILETMTGRVVNKPWNATSLKRYYQ
ncbi:uncharacterized protein LOC132268588 [Cornus florida]|uniref:uncharacterized protein LOC132268588 n=1 Tax=Cornus florida TaxID=4283 RepID=UPI0028A08300|nr:uncharacterized protein LOC132268588 [Cornus florida]